MELAVFARESDSKRNEICSISPWKRSWPIGVTIIETQGPPPSHLRDFWERKSVRFPLGWAIDLRPNVAGAPQNSMARAEKYEAWGGHFVGAVCCLRQQLSWLDRRTYTTLENLITVV